VLECVGKAYNQPRVLSYNHSRTSMVKFLVHRRPGNWYSELAILSRNPRFFF
jgi:hypothetical protein